MDINDLPDHADAPLEVGESHFGSEPLAMNLQRLWETAEFVHR